MATPVLVRVDHLVYATPDLNRGIDDLEKLLGIRATPGGQHLGIGTRNAVIALGPTTYFEIIGPDPEQPEPEKPRWFGLDTLRVPQLTAWFATVNDLGKLVTHAAEQGVKLGTVLAGSRRRPDGTLLSWLATDPRVVIADGIVPGFINWGPTVHPARNAAQGATLLDFRAEHPDPASVQKILTRLGIDLPVSTGMRATLIASVSAPKGLVELR